MRSKILVAVGAGLLSAFGGAQSARAGVSLAPLLACRTVSGAAARLACFDRESSILAHDSASEWVPPAAPQMMQLSPVAEFGLPPKVVVERETHARVRPAPLDHINARVTGLATGGDGLMVFTLSNGQVWQQVSSAGELLAHVGDLARISRGWLGSYSIRLPSKRGCKVRRVR